MSAMSHGRPGGGFGSGCQNEKEDIVMKKHGFRSIFSLLLAVMMVCSMLPTAAFAVEGVEPTPEVTEAAAEAPAEEPVEPVAEEPVEEPVVPAAEVPAEQSDGVEQIAQAGQGKPVVLDMPSPQANSSVPLTLTISSYGAPFKNGNTGAHDVYSVKWSQYIKQSDVGSNNASGSAYAYFKGSNESGWQLWLKVEVGNYKYEAAQSAWVYNKNMSAATGDITYGLSFNTAGGTSTYISISGAKDLPQPTPFTFILKFDANDGNGTFADVTKQSSAQYEILQIPSTYVPTREGYIFKGWKDTYWGSTYQVGSSINLNRTDTPACTVTDSSCTKTLYAEWEANAPEAPGEKPVMDALKQAVKITCVTPNSGHAAKIYDLMSGYTGGEVVKDSSGNYTYTITVNSGSYLNRYNSAAPDGVGATHELAPNEQPNKQITLKWDGAAWVADTTLPINFDVVCTATIPNPAADEFDDLKIQIKCDTKTDGSHDLQLSYKDGTYTFVRRDDPKYGFVVFTPSTYLDTYNKTHPGHTLKYPNGAVTWEFEYKDGSWQRRVTDKLPTIYVVCPNEPVAPKKPNSDEIKELLSGEVVKLYHQSSSQDSTCVDRTYQLMDGTFEVGDVSGDAATGYTCSVTVKAEAYLAEYNKVSVKSHSLAAEETGIETITLTWNTDGDNGRWVVQTETPVVFNVVCEATPPTDKPAAPAYNTIKNLTVKVVCPTHGYKEYGVVPAGLTAGEVQEQNGDYFCTVTIKSDAYVNDFNTKLGVEHTPKSEEKSVLLKYEDGVWVPDRNEDSPVIFNVSCTTQEKPTEETIINDLGSQVVGVVCTTMPNVHAALYSALREGTFDISDVTTVNGLPSCTITIHAETYVSAFNNSTEVIHQLKYPNETSKTLQLYYTDGKWTALDGTTSVVFEVVCPTAPVDAPTEEQIKAKLGKIQVKCVTEGSGHAVKEYDTSVGGYTAVTMQDKDGEPIYTVTITVPAQRYIEKYNEETGKTHQLASGEKAEKTVVLKYADKKWERVEGDLPVVFQVVCENIPAQKYTVTYTDGVDGVEVFKDQVYAGLTAGTATPAFNGTPTRVGYVFAGWNPAVAATVTGNATYAATWKVDSNNNGKPDDEELRYTVTYVDGANGKAFASQVYTGLLSGTATPKFNGTPLRSGYVFIGWSPVWSGTVTGNVTYTATWSTVTGGLDNVPKTGDNGLTLALSALLLFSFCGATACVICTKKRG